MAEKLTFDDGIKRIDINGNGLLCFNPSDFNLYQRFCALVKELPELEAQYKTEVEQIPEDAAESELIELAGKELNRAREIDATIKGKLSGVFGVGNDFDKLLNGVNLMAFGSNGERVITNLLNALTPYLEEGARKHMKEAAAGAVEEAQQNRAQRRAKQ